MPIIDEKKAQEVSDSFKGAMMGGDKKEEPKKEMDMGQEPSIMGNMMAAMKRKVEKAMY